MVIVLVAWQAGLWWVPAGGRGSLALFSSLMFGGPGDVCGPHFPFCAFHSLQIFLLPSRVSGLGLFACHRGQLVCGSFWKVWGKSPLQFSEPHLSPFL